MYSNKINLEIINKKIKTDFQTNAKVVIGIELTKSTITVTYKHALQAVR